MRRNLKHAKLILTVILAVLATVTVVQAQKSSAPPPNMPFRYGLGHEQYLEHCSACHGQSLDGTDKGPPLMHAYYMPSHHSDTAFYRAIQRGTQQHHWGFGDMAPVAGIAENEARGIIEFIRWYQRESGLF